MFATPSTDNINRRSAEALIRRVIGAHPVQRGWHGWPAHEANGWSFDVIGGYRDNDPVWIRVTRDGNCHLPAGQTLEESTRVFADWLAKFGYGITRESMVDPQVFRLVPGMISTSEVQT